MSVSGLASITPLLMLYSSSAASACSAEVRSDSPGMNMTTMSGAGWKWAQYVLLARRFTWSLT